MLRSGLGWSIALVLLASCGGSPVDPALDAGMDAGTDAGAEPPGCTDDDCDDGVFCNGPESCSPGAAGADARGCVAGDPPCEGPCIEASGECASVCPDADDDGYTDQACGGFDCDDTSPRVSPGESEVCDANDVDEDCDPETRGFRDLDGDTFSDARCCNGTHCGPDCDDESPASYRGAPETCDGRDNDCDGLVDEGAGSLWYPDADGDTFGDASAEPGDRSCDDPGADWADNDDDCDDTRADVNPALTETCNGRDDNCRDGIADESGCACLVTDPPRACGTDVGECERGTQRCASGMWSACEGGRTAMTEVCDPVRPGPSSGRDEDCDGSIDEGLYATGCYVDADGDSWGEGSARTVCAAAGSSCPPGFVARGGDCRGSDAQVHPGASETCDRVDEDCDGQVDEGRNVRRVTLPPPVAGCGDDWRFGRDLVCEQGLAVRCATEVAEGACPLPSGFFISVGGVITVGCARPALVRTNIARWELTARHSGCDGSSGEYNACQAAAHRYCSTAFGYVTGYTTLIDSRDGGVYSLSCFDSTQAVMRSVSWAALDARDGYASGGCTGSARDGWWCARAVDQYCRELGHATGFGPVEYNASTTTVACLHAY